METKGEGKYSIIQKICDMEQRIHYLEDQNLTVRKALDTALRQNKHLETSIENLGTQLTESDNRAKAANSFKEDILELLDTIQNYEVRISLLETKHLDVELDIRSLKEVEGSSRKSPSSADLKVNTLLQLVKDYDEARERQVVRQNKKIEACETKMKSIVFDIASSKSKTASQSSDSIITAGQHISVLQGNHLQYQPTVGLQYHMLPVVTPLGPLPPPEPSSAPVHHSLEIDETQYGSVVGNGGTVIDSLRDRSGARIMIREMRDQPPRRYYQVLVTGTTEQVKQATNLIQDAIAPAGKK